MYTPKLPIALALCLWWEVVNCWRSSSSAGRARVERSGGNTTYFGEVNITGFPSCAYTNCITSEQLSPSRLGCIEPELTTSCLCTQAPTPLSCAPEGPSDQDNCWFELEDWFAGECNGTVPVIDPSTLPKCSRSCVLAFLRDEGCATATRNCFCILSRAKIVQAATDCWAVNCSKKKVPPFSPSTWHDNICGLGNATVYDQSGYDGYFRMVRRVRLAMTILIMPVAVILVIYGIVYYTAWEEEKHSAEIGTALILIATALVLLIIVPVYVAL